MYMYPKNICSVEVNNCICFDHTGYYLKSFLKFLSFVNVSMIWQFITSIFSSFTFNLFNVPSIYLVLNLNFKNRLLYFNFTLFIFQNLCFNLFSQWNVNSTKGNFELIHRNCAYRMYIVDTTSFKKFSITQIGSRLTRHVFI